MSEIRVDAIKTRAGAVPTANDVGINVTGNVLQVQNFQTGSGLTTTTTMPYDDTIPQITEGGEVMTLNITPTSASSKLLITVITHLSGSVNAIFTTALFEGTTANALACSNTHGYGDGGQPVSHSVNHYMTSGTTSELTFRVRVGMTNPGTVTLNGRDGARKLGGSLISSITIMEIGV